MVMITEQCHIEINRCVSCALTPTSQVFHASDPAGLLFDLMGQSLTQSPSYHFVAIAAYQKLQM